MALTKATQNVISPNICTTDTTQTITGTKTFSSQITGNVTGNVTGSASLNVLKSGDTMTGALIVPAGATGSQAPRVSEVVLKAGDTMTGALVVPAGATGSQVPRVSEVVLKSGDTMTGGLIVSTSSSTAALTVKQTGSGEAFRVEDSPTSPDSSPFVITGAGNVGIGTSTPTQKLDVFGSISCYSIYIDGNQFNSTIVPSFTARINGGIADITAITSITFVINGSQANVTITKASHGLLVDDSITFIGQTGNNSVLNNTVLNGAWKITSTDTNTFQFSIDSIPAGALSATGITSGTPIRIARFISVWDAGYGNFTPNKIGHDANGSYTIYFYNDKDTSTYLAIGNCCNTGTASGTFSPYAYSTKFFGFKTYTIGTATGANFTDINVAIY